MSAALPAWRQQAQRQREQDLIFRGEQYARAVALYYLKNSCTLPTNVDDLVSRKFLRKKWKDPITDDDFVLIPGAQPGQTGAPGTTGRGGPPINNPQRGTGAPPMIGGGQNTGRTGAPSTGAPSTGFPGQSGSTLGGGGIAGVMSKSTASSIMIYNGQQAYNGWQFVYQSQLQKMGQTPQCGGANQGPGRGVNQPGRGGPVDGRGVGRGGPDFGRGVGGPGRQGAPGRGRDAGPGPIIGRGRGGGGGGSLH